MTHKPTFCDGLGRRDLLKIGTAGLFCSGFSLAGLLAGEGPATGAAAASRRDVSLIILFLKGGLSTIDTLDLKPRAPAEVRGEFNPIATNVPGIEIGEHLPRLARQLDKFSLVRSFSQSNSEHGPADHYLLTGYHPVAGFNPALKPNNQRPSHGSVIAKKLGPRGSIPPYVCLPKMHHSCGPSFLGSSVAPFVVEADPNAPNFTVPDLLPPLAIDAGRLGARKELMTRVDRFQQAAEIRANRSAQSLSVFQQKAFGLMTSASAKSAFDIREEPETLRNEYGRTSLGQSCLMARRLVEAGVRCVTIDHTNWDNHNEIFPVLKNELLPQLDPGVAALFRDLADRGMLGTTLVIVTGEFGRTPRVNERGGRDHWGASSTILIGGGGVQGGRVVGASNERAEKPAGDPFGPEDLAATMFHLLGIDPNEELYTPEGRPHKLANNGRLISGLL